MSAAKTVLEVRELCVSYPRRREAPFEALRDVSFELRERETLALVGASGSGKSTLAKALVGLLPFRGAIVLGDEVGEHVDATPERLRRSVQLVFQDPGASLDPRMRVGPALDEVLAHVLRVRSRIERRARAAALLESVGLSPALYDAAPGQLSGGQRQRVAIARALAVEPRVLVCDEVLSALDSPVQAQVLELLASLRRERGLAVLFITHDLAVARRCADRIGVMQAGEIVESGAAASLFETARHAHTRELWDARPRWPVG